MTYEPIYDYLRALVEVGDIKQADRSAILKRYTLNSGKWTWFSRDGKRYLITDEAIACDCGKGLYCPLVKVAPATKTGHVKKWMWS